MKIPVKESKEYTTVVRVTSGSITPTRGGIATGNRSTRLAFYTQDYGVDNYPVNINTLELNQQFEILAKYRDNSGCWLSSKAFNQYKLITA